MKSCKGACCVDAWRTSMYQLETAIDDLLRKGVELNKAVECQRRRKAQTITPSLCAPGRKPPTAVVTPPKHVETPHSLDNPSSIKVFEYSTYSGMSSDLTELSAKQSREFVKMCDATAKRRTNSRTNSVATNTKIERTKKCSGFNPPYEHYSDATTLTIDTSIEQKQKKRTTIGTVSELESATEKYSNGEANYHKYDLVEYEAVLDGKIIVMPARIRIINRPDGSTLIHYIVCDIVGTRMLDIKASVRGETAEELIINGARIA